MLQEAYLRPKTYLPRAAWAEPDAVTVGARKWGFHGGSLLAHSTQKFPRATCWCTASGDSHGELVES